MKNEKRLFASFLIAATLGLGGCQTAPVNLNQNATANVAANASPNISPTAGNIANTNSNIAASAAKNETHEHAAPHGGTLIAFGDEYAHLELVLDPTSGQLTAYALDGEAEKSVPLAQPEIEVAVEKPRKFLIKLAAQENALTGEKAGATSEFRAASNELANLTDFDARVVSIKIRGREFKNTHFNFPKGNEGNHRH